MYDEILVPTDGSPAAEAAIDHAINIASQFDSRVHVINVVDDAAYSTMEGGTETVIEALEDEGEEAVDRVAEAVEDADLESVTTVTTGTAYSAIRDYVEENGIDLLVMGTHGRRGVDRYLIGSVAERVVRTSEIPVLTVRQPDDETEAEP